VAPDRDGEASSNGRTADFGSAYEGSNPSASAKPPAVRSPNQRAEVKPLAMPARLVIVPLGALPRALLGEVAAALSTTYGPPSAVGPAQQRPEYAFNKDRHQYHSTAVLRRLAQLRGAEPAGVPVLGVTDVDLFIPDAPFVFGEADRAARSAVVSLHRLAQGPDGKPADTERLKRRLQVSRSTSSGTCSGCPTARTPAAPCSSRTSPPTPTARAWACAAPVAGRWGWPRSASTRAHRRAVIALCQRGPASCGACCGLYNRADLSRQGAHQALTRRT
jgi:archaemetzincin